MARDLIYRLNCAIQRERGRDGYRRELFADFIPLGDGREYPEERDVVAYEFDVDDNNRVGMITVTAKREGDGDG